MISIPASFNHMDTEFVAYVVESKQGIEPRTGKKTKTTSRKTKK
jgi:hypothetical protein